MCVFFLSKVIGIFCKHLIFKEPESNYCFLVYLRTGLLAH
jgi:hypothetical protein